MAEDKKKTKKQAGTISKKSTSKKPATKKATATKKTAAKKPATKKATVAKKSPQDKAKEAAKNAKKGGAKKAAAKKGGLQKGFLRKGKSSGTPPKLIQAKKPEEESPLKRSKSNRDNRRARAKRSRIIGVCVMCVAVLVITLGCFNLAGALTLNAGYACKVNDSYTKEADVTQYIRNQTIYKQYAKSTQAWAQMLGTYGYTSDKFREQILEEHFIHNDLVKLAAEDQSIEVSEEEVDQKVDGFKAKYDNDDNYHKALDSAGYTEDSYRDHCRQTILERKLTDKVVEKKNPSDDDLKTYISNNVSLYKDARKTSHILFDAKDNDKAQQVLDQIKAGTLTFEAAVAQYSTDEETKTKAGDRGWDKLKSFSTSYNSSLSGLEVGAVYQDLVKDSEGIHIVKCTEKWQTPEKIESLEGIPADILNECREKKMEDTQSTDLKTWLDTFKSEHEVEVTIFPMPGDVPYNVNPTGNNQITQQVGGTTGTTN